MPNPISPELATLIRVARAKYAPSDWGIRYRHAAAEALEFVFNLALYDLEQADLTTEEDACAFLEELSKRIGDDALCFYLESDVANDIAA